MLQTADNRFFEVIDGQQRLTTLNLIVLAAMRLIKELIQQKKDAEKNQKRLEQLRASYVGYLDPVTLRSQSKLMLNRNNNDYYSDYLVTLADHLPQRGFTASTHTLRKGFEWFKRHLNQSVKTEPDVGMAPARLLETMSDKLFFTVITVADELNAYKVFETLNARGVRLSSTDLLKHYLFSVAARSQHSTQELPDLERCWENLVGRLGSESFPDFLRMHWNSRHTFARHSDLFKTIRNTIQSLAEVFNLVRAMDEDIDTYLALTQPEGAQWVPEWKTAAQELRMFSVRQPYPMLMAARRVLADEDFSTLLRATVVLTFRYNVIGSQHTGEQERLYNDIARKLHDGSIQTLQELLERLRPIYRLDAAFRADFAEKIIKTTQSRNAKVVRYILCQLERHQSSLEIDPNSPNYTIEHVLLQSPQDGWDTFEDRDLGNFIFRLGNMVLLEKNLNQEAANQSYAQRRCIYARSQFCLTRQLAQENTEWTPQQLQQRQQQMARLATGI